MPSRSVLPLLCLTALCLACCHEPIPTASRTIRIVTANLTSGNGQDYDAGHGNRILQGLDPDIALIQEMSYLSNTPQDLRAWVDATFGREFVYFREPGPGIPNGIVSRFPIRSAGEWDDPTIDNRDFAWARIDIPGAKDLWAISVHLKASSDSASQRTREARELLSHVKQSIPKDDYVVLGGDFNTHDRGEPCLQTLADYFVIGGPYPVDQRGDGDTNANRNSPYDWVLADADLHGLRTAVIIGSNSFPDGLVFDSRKYTALTSVAPVKAGDSSAPNMQHMAVVRAFTIPH